MSDTHEHSRSKLITQFAYKIYSRRISLQQHIVIVEVVHLWILLLYIRETVRIATQSIRHIIGFKGN